MFPTSFNCFGNKIKNICKGLGTNLKQLVALIRFGFVHFGIRTQTMIGRQSAPKHSNRNYFRGGSLSQELYEVDNSFVENH